MQLGAISLGLFILLVYGLFYLGIEVYQRNRQSALHRTAAFIYLLGILILTGQLLSYAAPFEYAQLALYGKYGLSFVLFSALIFFYGNIAPGDREQRSGLPYWMAAASAPPLLLLFLPAFAGFGVSVSETDAGRIATADTPLLAALIGAGLWTALSIGAILTAAWSRIRTGSESFRERRQWKILVAGYAVLLFGGFALAALDLAHPGWAGEWLGPPLSGNPAWVLLVWGVVLRHAMAKYDLLPPPDGHYRILFELSPFGILILDREATIAACNPNAEKLIGCRPGELNGLPLQQLLPTERRAIFMDRYQTYFQTRRAIRSELTVIDFTGKPIEVKVDTDYFQTERETYQFAIVQDITGQRETERHIRHLAYYDALTGLANREQFQEQLQNALSRIRPGAFGVAVMIVDLDRFKSINDTLGLPVGDYVLRHVAQLLRRVVDEGHTVARLGGDEFAVLVPRAIHAEEVRLLGEHIVAEFRKPVSCDGYEFSITGSVGVCFVPVADADADELLRRASVAMYRAKHLGRNQCVLYSPAMNRNAADDRILVNHLHKALERNELLIHYQPQVQLLTGEVTGMEALLRWRTAEGRMIPPSQFIPYAEESGLINEIGYFVLEAACRQAAAWDDAGIGPLIMSVNLSGRQLLQSDFTERLAAILRNTGIGPGRLCLEITESIAIQNSEVNRSLFRELSEMGVLVALDDFGTGYSSLSVLKLFPFRVIKIDRSFIGDMLTDENDEIIVRTIIGMSRNLKLQVVAEGVETAEQWTKLLALGCHYAQGYYIGRPMPAEEIADFLQTWTTANDAGAG